MGTDYKVELGGRFYTPQEISAKILQKLKAEAENYLGTTVTKAVITVPAYFTDAQRQATKDAGARGPRGASASSTSPPPRPRLRAGQGREDQTILVYDLGGGTFDVSSWSWATACLKSRPPAATTTWAATTSTSGSSNIWWRSSKRTRHRLCPRPHGDAAPQDAAEKAKIELSGLMQTNINLPFITQGPDGPLHLDIDLTRAKFNELTADLVEATIGTHPPGPGGRRPSAEQIDKVILVGGSTRMPAVQEAIKRLMGKEPTKGVNPDEVVAVGAAIQAGVLAGEVKDVVLLDVTPLSLGIETLGGVFTKLIERNTTIPTSKKQIYHGGRQPDRGGHPRPPRRAAHGCRQRDSGPVSAHGHPACAPRRASDRGDL